MWADWADDITLELPEDDEKNKNERRKFIVWDDDLMSKPSIAEGAKIGSYYSISCDRVLGYCKSIFTYDIVNFTKWLKKNTKDNKNYFHVHLNQIILKYAGNGIFEVFLTPYKIIVRENNDDYHLNSGVMLQRGVSLYRDLKEINMEDIAKILYNKEIENYYINSFTVFNEEASKIKKILDQKNADYRQNYIQEKDENQKRGEILALKHNNINSGSHD